MTRPRGSMRGWLPRRERQKAIFSDLLARYKQHDDEGTLPRSPRGIFYDLRPEGMGNGITYRKPDSLHPIKSFGPMEAHPKAVGETLALMRRADIIKEWWIADAQAPSALVPSFDESAEDEARAIAERVKTAAEWFSLDRQRYQPLYIEVLCEAADLQSRLSRVVRDYGVPVYSGAGFDGIKGKRDFADRAMSREVPTVVLNIGDCDRYGEDIYRAVAEDAVAWADGADLRFQRLALTIDQAKELDLLDADGKAEVDGVPVPVMDRWLTDAIENLQVPTCRERLLAEEEQQRRDLPDAIRRALKSAA